MKSKTKRNFYRKRRLGGGGGVTQGEGLVIAVWQKCVAESLPCGRNVLPSHCRVAEMCCRVIAVSMDRIVSPVQGCGPNEHNCIAVDVMSTTVLLWTR